MPQQPDNFTVMGRVGVPFGVRGWVKVQTYTATSDSLLDYPVWWLGRNGQWREFSVLEYAGQAKSLAVHFAGCDDRDAAAALRGGEIAVPRSALPQPPENEYYWADLIGLEVVDKQGRTLGRVTGLLETGANDVLVVQGERERLIPFVAQFVPDVDVKAGLIRVDWDPDW